MKSKNIVETLPFNAPICKEPFKKYPHVKLFIVSSPSGTGKSGLIARTIGPQGRVKKIEFLVTHTTRLLRPGEIDGVHYFNVTVRQFQKMKRNGEFAETNAVYEDHLYGTSYAELNRIAGAACNGITDLDVDGALRLKDLFPNNVCTIFLQPQNEQQVLAQLTKRAEQDKMAPDELERRIKRFHYEMAKKSEFDCLITNVYGEPDYAFMYLNEIIYTRTYSGEHAFIC